MSSKIPAFVGFGSFSLLAGAFWFQHVMGLAPCQMCIWQRWPHVAVVCLCGLYYLTQRPVFAYFLPVVLCISVGLGVLHVGVEQAWWDGPTACSGGLQTQGLSPEQLLTKLLEAPVIRCDQVSWRFLMVSMAGWNALWSFVLLVCALLYVYRSRVQADGRRVGDI